MRFLLILFFPLVLFSQNVVYDYSVYKIYNGNSYTYTFDALSLSAGLTTNVVIITGKDESHLNCSIQSRDDIILHIYEKPTITNYRYFVTNSFLNCDRNSTKACKSVLTYASSTNDITSFGTLKFSYSLKSAGMNGIILPDSKMPFEFILKTNSIYVFQLLSAGANAKIALQISFYED